jgi:tyrosyl-tRNA synthetase
MGKTAKGAVWLTADRLSPHEYWQFWRDVDDADVGRFLRLFTDLPLAEIARLEKLEGQELNEAKKVLATEATRLAHGADAETEALTSISVPGTELAAGIPVFRLFVLAGLAASNGEARRLIRGGGARANDVPITDEAATLSAADLVDGAIKLSAGRKQHRLIRPD